jgi:hypothetical protein
MRPALCSVLACLFLLSCGYRWQGFGEPDARSVLGNGNSTLLMGKIEDESLYPDLPYYLRSLVRDEINLRRLARWVDSGDADYTMDIRIPSFRIDAYISDSDSISLLNAAAVELEVIVRHGTGSSVAWRSGNIVYSEHYEAPSEAGVIREVLAQALYRALDRMQMEF